MKKQLKTSFLIILGILTLFLKCNLNLGGMLGIFLTCLGILLFVFGIFTYIKHNSIIAIGIDVILQFIFGIF